MIISAVTLACRSTAERDEIFLLPSARLKSGTAAAIRIRAATFIKPMLREPFTAAVPSFREEKLAGSAFVLASALKSAAGSGIARYEMPSPSALTKPGIAASPLLIL